METRVSTQAQGLHLVPPLCLLAHSLFLKIRLVFPQVPREPKDPIMVFFHKVWDLVAMLLSKEWDLEMVLLHKVRELAWVLLSKEWGLAMVLTHKIAEPECATLRMKTTAQVQLAPSSHLAINLKFPSNPVLQIHLRLLALSTMAHTNPFLQHRTKLPEALVPQLPLLCCHLQQDPTTQYVQTAALVAVQTKA